MTQRRALESMCRDQRVIAEHTDVLNGIAYDPATRRLWVTGKFWPKVFEIRLVKR